MHFPMAVWRARRRIDGMEQLVRENRGVFINIRGGG